MQKDSIDCKLTSFLPPVFHLSKLPIMADACQAIIPIKNPICKKAFLFSNYRIRNAQLTGAGSRLPAARFSEVNLDRLPLFSTFNALSLSRMVVARILIPSRT